MIKLTGTSGTVVYINPDKIIAFNEDDGKTFIEYGNDRYIVTEPAAEVARKVLEYRLAIIQYESGTNHQASAKMTEGMTDYQAWGRHLLNRLAGLEDQA